MITARAQNQIQPDSSENKTSVHPRPLTHSGNKKNTLFSDSGFIQLKTEACSNKDKYEQDDDDVANKVMRMPDPSPAVRSISKLPNRKIQQLCPDCHKRLKQGNPFNCPECEQKLQRKHVISSTGGFDRDLEIKVNSLRGGVSLYLIRSYHFLNHGWTGILGRFMFTPVKKLRMQQTQ